MPYGSINNMEKAFSHCQVRVGQIVNIIDSHATNDGKLKVTGFPIKFSDTKPSIELVPRFWANIQTKSITKL
ncbi:hypothetical protein AJ80_05186 [Polytolypa hystricis UAMH7299]|uniref:Uncharacterized protein n=1 Tax=Polytolypa hystricis (strain UAMH7299) TaxID=1447883 RepID=A0A2B7Y675_POLH7|nr:hypothetical protein AJ80_05186 [Polytolypa hystricis UAMH7299]